MTHPKVIWPVARQKQVLVDPLLEADGIQQRPQVVAILRVRGYCAIKYRWQHEGMVITASCRVEPSVLARHPHKSWFLNLIEVADKKVTTAPLYQEKRPSFWYKPTQGFEAKVERIGRIQRSIETLIS